MNTIPESQLQIHEIKVRDYVTKSNLPASDFVINPYVGCPHACKYCYACFMKRFSGHTEPWGAFLDVKQCDRPISVRRLTGKSVFLSSVTDCYHPLEEKYQITRRILEQLKEISCELVISTKSKLILRDLDYLTQCRNLKVSMSINTLDENVRRDMDRACSIKERLETLEKLHDSGIHTVLFMSPILPGLTDFRSIVEASKHFVDEYWFENLNLRGSYKKDMMAYIDDKYPQFHDLYHAIYCKKNMAYWDDLAVSIDSYCRKNQIQYTNYFYHKILVEQKKKRASQSS